MQISLKRKDVLWSYIGTIMSMGGSFLMLPFIIYYLDGDMLGLWYVFTSIGAIATLFDFGFSPAFARNIAYSWSGVKTLQKENTSFSDCQEPNFRLMKTVLGICKRIYLLLAFAALLLFLCVGSAYIGYIAREIHDASYWIAWLIYCLAIFLNLYFGYYSSFLRGVGAIASVNKITVIARSIQIVLTVALLMSGMGLIGACIAYLAYGVTFRLLGKQCFYQYQDIGKQLKAIPDKDLAADAKEMFGIVWHNAWKDGIVSLANFLSNQASTVICSLFLSLTETGIYSLAVQITTAIATIASALYTAYQPSLQTAYVNRNRGKQCRIMSLLICSYVVLFVLGMAALVWVGLPILRIIKPATVISIPVLLGIGLYQFILKLRNCYTSYFSCTNRIPYVKAFLLSASVCILLSLILEGVYHMGIWGLVFAQLTSQLIYNAWAWPLKAHRELALGVGQMPRLAWEEFIDTFRNKEQAGDTN